MAAVFLHSFSSPFGGTPYPAAWRWDSTNSSEASDMVSKMEAQTGDEAQNLTVEDTGTGPVLTWDVYQYFYGYDEDGEWRNGYFPTGLSGSLALAHDLVVVWPSQPFGGGPVQQISTMNANLDGWWVSDKHGRPYSSSDLLAGQ